MNGLKISAASWLSLLLAGILPATGSAAEAFALGRLFMTPEQRTLLDQQREQLAGQESSDGMSDLLPRGAVAGRRLVLNGVVLREGTKPRIWINGQNAGAAGSGAQVRQGPDARGRVTLESGANRALVRLKPGQAWDPVSGRITDCVRCDRQASPDSGKDSAQQPEAAGEEPVAAADPQPAASVAASNPASAPAGGAPGSP